MISLSESTPETDVEEPVQWPNKVPPLDGIVPSDEVSQEPDFLTETPEVDPDTEGEAQE